VPAASSLLVRPSAVEQLDELRAAVATIIARPLPPAPTASTGTLVPVRVVYDGPDLAEVAELTGLGVAGVVAAHTGTPWRVAFGGFAPGFSYLADGDPRLVVPRRSEPRTSVPAGSVGLAGEFSGVYPRESPGGWQLVGRTDAVLWDARRTPPALLSPGTWVRFEAVSS
jgi:KipI family sensor histidine kinase inhibitor